MIRLICPKCKNAYLDDKDTALVCSECGTSFDSAEKNLLLGIQYYNEGDLDKANDCLMKHIVQNGADAQAIFYKALCDSFIFDEDTLSLNETYDKLFQSLKDLPQELFPNYLALANDETEKLEKALAKVHINLLIDADAEKIKKTVSTIINLQNEAKAFRIKLNALVNEYNDVAPTKISVSLSDSFLVEPEFATEIGNAKFNRIAENIAAHTVFTGILSTDIKNLEIYYRCIVMFFKKNRQKYEFLMASAEKFNELSTLLENGQYSTIKGTTAIGDKLKSAGYDFFQESLKDHDEDFNVQKETVVFIEVEEPVTEEEPEFEDISSTSVAETEDTTESTENTDVISLTKEPSEEVTEEAAENETADATETEDTISVTEDTISVEEATDDVIEIEAEEPVCEDAEIIEDDPTEAPAFTVTIPEEELSADKFEVIDEIPVQEEEQAPAKATKRKKSYAPFITILLIVIGVVAIICLTVIPQKTKEKNYNKANELFASEKYEQAAEVYAELGDYEDAQNKVKEAKYNYAAQLEKAEKYEQAKSIYDELGTYEDSLAKSSSCVYNLALNALDDGKFDTAKALFETIPDYADSKTQVLECDFRKAEDFVAKKEYERAIEIFISLEDYSTSKEKILEAKYKYIKDNYSKDNETTLAFIEDLIEARYSDIAAIRRDLLGPSEEEKPVEKPTQKPVETVVTCINYTEADYKTNLTEVDRTKPIFFHITVNDTSLYGKKLTLKFTTSVGYSETKSFTFKEGANTYALPYPSTDVSNYTVEFEVINGNKTVKSQTVTVK